MTTKWRRTIVLESPTPIEERTMQPGDTWSSIRAGEGRRRLLVVSDTIEEVDA